MIFEVLKKMSRKKIVFAFRMTFVFSYDSRISGGKERVVAKTHENPMTTGNVRRNKKKIVQ